MSVPNIMDNIPKYSTLAKEYRRLTPIVEIGEKYISINKQIIEDEEILKGQDAELKALVKDEIDDLNAKLIQLEKIPKGDPNPVLIWCT